MHWLDIQKKAEFLNIKFPDRYSMTDLIQTIQRAEGNFDCFSRVKGSCSQLNCCWRSECLK